MRGKRASGTKHAFTEASNMANLNTVGHSGIAQGRGRVIDIYVYIYIFFFFDF